MARKLQVEIVGNSRDLERAFGRAAGASSGFGSKMASVGRVAGIAFAALGTGAVFAGKKMISMASDAAEVDSKMQVVFGKALPELTKNLDKFSEVTGASRFALREQAADMGALLEPLTKNKKGAADMSAQFVKLATDLGSFNNVPVADALLAIRSGLVGEAEPLRRFGVLLNAAAVEAEGLRLGLVKKGETMTEQEKVQARASLIMQQTSLAQGDATRTAGSMANQMKELKNNVADAATSIGTALMPAALAAVTAFNTHWPTIQAVAGRAMAGIGSAIGSAVDVIRTHWDSIASAGVAAFNAARTVISSAVGTIRTHWDTIASTGKTAFTGIKTTVSGLGNFISSPIGTQVTIAVGFFTAFVLAADKAKDAYIAMKTVFTAGAFSSPFGLVVGGIGILAGLVASQLIPSMMDGRRSLDTLGDGAKQAADQINGLKDALRGLNDKQAEARGSNTAYQGAMLALHTTLAEGVVIRQKYKQGSQEVIVQEQREKEAADGVKDALERKKRAQEDLIGQSQKVKQAVGDTTSELFKTAGAYRRVADQQSQGEVFAKSFRAETDRFSATLTGNRNKHLEMAQAVASTNPVLAANQRQIAINDQTILTLTRSLGRIPKKTEIIAALKDPESIRKATAELDKLPGAATKAGAGATSGLQKGMAPMGERANAATRKVPEIVRGFAGATRSGGFATGSAGGQGVAEGIMSQIPAIRAAAAAASAASVITMQRTLRTGSRSKETYEKAGIPAGQGLVEGITDYLKANGTKVADAAKKATDIAAQVLPSIQAAGRVLGLEKARAIAMGVLQGSPGLAQQMKKAVSDAAAQAMAAAATKVREAKEAFGSAFSELSSAALAAFDSQVAKWKSPSQKLLEKMQLQDQLKQLKDAIDAGKTGIATAKEALDKALAGEEVAKVRERGGTPEEIAAAEAAQAEAVKAAQAQVLAAQETFNQAVRAKTQFHLAQRAREEEEAHAKLMEKRRVHFENQLAQLQNRLAAHPKEHAKIQQQILDLLDTYVPGFRLKGEKIGFAIAKGIRDSIADVKAAFAEMLEAVNSQEVVKKAAKAGARAGASPKIAGGIGPNVAMAGGSGTGDVHIHLHGGTYADERALNHLADKVRSEFYRTQSRNTSLGFR